MNVRLIILCVCFMAFFTRACEKTVETPELFKSKYEDSLFTLVNLYRKAVGKKLLKKHPTVQQEARDHSKKMAEGNVPYSHVGLIDRKNDLISLKIADSVAESIMYGNFDAKRAFDLWIKNPKINTDSILVIGDFNYTGVGVVQKLNTDIFYYTQIFVKCSNDSLEIPTK